MKIIEINIPEYAVDKEPDYRSIGKLLDNILKQHFLEKSVLVRGIASSEHSGKSLEELIEIINLKGTDRYDPNQAGDRYDNMENKHIDLFAFPANVTQSADICHQIIYGFYYSSISVHGRPMRIDVVTIYDANQMTQVIHKYEGRNDTKDDGFVFKYPKDKQSALIGIIKIL